MTKITKELKNSNIAKKESWYIISDSTLNDVLYAIATDEIFLRNIKYGKAAIIHLPKKHSPIIIERVVNYILSEFQYEVFEIHSRLYGIDVYVTKKLKKRL